MMTNSRLPIISKQEAESRAQVIIYSKPLSRHCRNTLCRRYTTALKSFKRRAVTTSHSRAPHIWCSRRSESDDSGCRRESFSVCGLPISSLSRCPAEMRRLSSILITFYLTAITISVASAQFLPRPTSVHRYEVVDHVTDFAH